MVATPRIDPYSIPSLDNILLPYPPCPISHLAYITATMTPRQYHPLYQRYPSLAVLAIALVCAIILWVANANMYKSPSLRPSVPFPLSAGQNIHVGPREKCAIVYHVAVEGSGHHGFAPMMDILHKNQIDPNTGLPTHERDFDGTTPFVRRSLFMQKGVPIDDPALVREFIRNICPDDGRNHVLEVGDSFPSKGTDSDYYRVDRDFDWRKMNMHEIAASETGKLLTFLLALVMKRSHFHYIIQTSYSYIWIVLQP